jgi:PAS domain S-box-containing protein
LNKSLYFFFILLLNIVVLQATEFKVSDSEKAWLNSHPKIKVGLIKDNPPQSLLNTDGSVEGIDVEFVKLLNERLNGQLEIVTDSWGELYSSAVKKKIDVLFTFTPSEERKKHFNFTSEYMSFPHVIVAKGDGKHIVSLNSLKGRSIALESGTFLIDYIKSNYPSVTIYEYENALGALKAVNSGEVDAYIGSKAPVDILLNTNNFGDMDIHSNSSETSETNVIAIRKDWPILASLLDRALASIPHNDLPNLINNHGDSITESSYPSLMKEKVGVSLIAEEKAWLLEHPIIRIAAHPAWDPIESIEEDGNYKGLAIDYLKKIEEMLGVRFEFIKEDDWVELIKLAKQKQVDLFPCIPKSSERGKYLLFTENFAKMPNGIFTNEDVNYISNLNMVKDEKFAVVEGYAIHDYLVTNFPDIDLVLVKNLEQGIEYVNQKKAFGLIGNVVTIGHHIINHGALHLKLSGEIPFVSTINMGVRKDWPLLRDIIQKSINSISYAERNAIYSQWVPIILEKPIDYNLFWEIGAGFLIVMILISYWNISHWNRKLSVEVNKKTRSLSLSEATARALLNSLSDTVLLLDRDGIIQDCNLTAPDNFSLNRDELIGTSVWDILPENIVLKRKQYINTVFESGESVRFQDIRNGKWFDNVIYPIHDELQNVTMITVLARDITVEKQTEEHLIESEDFLNRTGEMAKVGGWQLNFITNELLWTKTTSTIHEVPDEYIPDLNDAITFYHPDDRVMVSKAIGNSKESGGAYHLIARIITAKDKLRWVHVIGQPIIVDGQCVKITGTLHDITERKLAEETLQRSEERIKIALEGTNTGLWEWNIDSSKFYFSHTWLTMLGYELDELPHEYQTWVNLTHPDDIERVEGILDNFLKNKRDTFSSEFRMRKKDGSYLWIHSRAAVVERDDARGIKSIVGLHTDITERKLVQEKLQESEMLYRTLFNSVDEGIALMKDSIYINCNAKFGDILGCPVDQIVGQSPYDFSPPTQPDGRDSIETALVYINRALEGDRVFFEWKHKKADGTLCDAEITLNLVEVGSEKFILVIHRDITDRKQAVQKEKQHTEQLQQADKMASLGVLVSGVAHEINNPNNFISLNTPILKSAWESAMPVLEEYYKNNSSFEMGGVSYEDMKDMMPELFEGLEDGTTRIASIVNDLKNYARKDVSNYEFSVDVNQVVNNAVNLLNNQLKNGTKNFSIELMESPVFIKGNSQKLEQVVVNLLQNGCNALMSKDRSLSIDIKEDDGFCLIKVIDEGVGIPKEYMGQLTDPFFTTRRSSGGTGLGLSVSAGIIKEHGGELTFESEVDKGTTVIVKLPLADYEKEI